MQFLTVSRGKAPTVVPDESLLKAEIHRAKSLYSHGYMRQLWHRSDGPGACTIWEVDDQSGLWKLLQSLPFVQAGLVEVSVIPLRPWAGFAPAEEP